MVKDLDIDWEWLKAQPLEKRIKIAETNLKIIQKIKEQKGGFNGKRLGH